MVGLEDELRQRPLLQLVLVLESLDGEVLEALLCVDCAPKVLNHGINHLFRRAAEAVNLDIGGRL